MHKNIISVEFKDKINYEHTLCLLIATRNIDFDGQHHEIPLDDEDRESFELDDEWLTADEYLEKQACLESRVKLEKLTHNIKYTFRQQKHFIRSILYLIFNY